VVGLVGLVERGGGVVVVVVVCFKGKERHTHVIIE